jgi:glycosyltransferase involved in cell wall biosynthesis
MPKLSVVIITRNEERNILRCLESVEPMADEIVVVDSGSTDRTLQICRESGCKIFTREFDGYGSQKQFAVDQAFNDWVLSIDADEVLSEELTEEIKQLLAEPGTGITHPGYIIPFALHYMGRILRHGGVGHEHHLRLFNRTRGGFTLVPVHEGIELKGIAGALKGHIIHYSYHDIGHHLEKINTYTTQAANGYRKKGRTFSGIGCAFQFPASFISRYILKGGFLDGYPGFMWAFMAAVYATLKVAKTIELKRKP